MEKLILEDMPVSSLKYPYIVFNSERTCGNIILEIDGLSKEVDGGSSLAKTTLFDPAMKQWTLS